MRQLGLHLNRRTFNEVPMVATLDESLLAFQEVHWSEHRLVIGRTYLCVQFA